jgi:hypothetical protein
MDIDRKTVALGIALGYPEQAFEGLGSSAYARAEELIRRAGLREPITAKVAAFLQDEEELGEWIAELLEDPDLRPPHLRPRAVMSYSMLASEEPAPVSARRYTCVADDCPADDYTWYQASIGVPIPACRFCGGELVAA